MNRPFPFLSLGFRTLLLILLAIDLCFILVHVLAVLAYDGGLISHVPTLLKITEDRSLPEDFNYLEWSIIVVALVWMTIRDRWLAPLLWALVFLIILIDDAFQMHEQVGKLLSARFEFSDNALIYGNDIGELAVFSVMGLLTLAIIGVLLTRRDQASRLMTRRYFWIMLALAFFGVGIDAMHSVVAHLAQGRFYAPVLAQIFGMIEDGGEMLVASLATAITLAPGPARVA